MLCSFTSYTFPCLLPPAFTGSSSCHQWRPCPCSWPTQATPQLCFPSPCVPSWASGTSWTSGGCTRSTWGCLLSSPPTPSTSSRESTGSRQARQLSLLDRSVVCLAARDVPMAASLQFASLHVVHSVNASAVAPRDQRRWSLLAPDCSFPAARILPVAGCFSSLRPLVLPSLPPGVGVQCVANRGPSRPKARAAA